MILENETGQSAEVLQTRFEWAGILDASAIPSETMQRAPTIPADDIAAMVVPKEEPELHQFLDRSAKPLEGGEASVFLDARRVALEQAAMAKAAIYCWCQLDEGYRRTSCHAGVYVLPVREIGRIEDYGATYGWSRRMNYASVQGAGAASAVGRDCTSQQDHCEIQGADSGFQR